MASQSLISAVNNYDKYIEQHGIDEQVIDAYIQALSVAFRSGTVVPTNNASAKGIVFEDVDITDDEKKPISVIIAGRVIKANLPVAVDTNAETALKASGIYFD